MDKLLEGILLPAYAPCIGFSTACTTMRWDPTSGHVPRGFSGCARTVEDVEAIFVFAEPGDPHVGESHDGLRSAYDYATQSIRNGTDQFHRNVRRLLDICWPHMAFDEQLSKVWMSESVLCSAKKECGAVPRAVIRECGERYLKKEIDLFPNALVVALGAKARDRLQLLGIENFESAIAMSPRGCNSPEALKSWERVGDCIAARRGERQA